MAEPETEYRSSAKWWATGLVAVVAFFFGFRGMQEYELINHADCPLDRVSIFYHTLQLFLLHAPHLDGTIPRNLHIGRILACGPIVVAAVVAFIKIFPNEWNLMMLRLSLTGGHIVVCGLGAVGQRLALEGRRRGFRVVAIDKACPSSTRQLMHDRAVVVFDGDASDEQLLKKARVTCAAFVVAACQEDHTNAAIAARVEKALEQGEKRKGALTCHTFIGSADLRRLLSEGKFFNANLTRSRVTLSSDEYDVAARQVLRLHRLDIKPLGENEATVVHLVIIGFGRTGQSLAIHAARSGHFANETTDPKRRLRITVVSSDVQAIADFKSRYPNLNLVCDFSSQAPPASSLGPALGALCQPGTFATYAFCEEGAGTDEENFRMGIDLVKDIQCPVSQVFVRQSSSSGLSALLPSLAKQQASLGRIYPFGMIEDVLGWDVLLRSTEDVLAEALHNDYQERHKGHQGWDNLREDFRDSNRQAADHIDIKLAALGYHQEPLTKTRESARILSFSEEEIKLLAKMEHLRWNAERWLALPPWALGPVTNRDARVTDALVPWDNLTKEHRETDREQIKAIPGALEKIGIGIYR